MDLGNKKIFFPKALLFYFESSSQGLSYFTDKFINRLQKVRM